MAYIVASEASLSGEATATFSVSIPAGHASGDVLIAIVTQDGGGTTIAAAGWTLIGAQAANQGQRTAVFYNVATSGSEADIDLTGATDEWIVTILIVRGADTSTPVNISARFNSANSTTAFLDAGSVTTTADGCLVLYAAGFDGVSKWIPENPNDLVAATRETDFVGCTQLVGYRNQLSAGATPVVKLLSESASEGGSAWVIAINDANPAAAQLGPMIGSGYDVVKRYGGITTAASTVRAFIRHDGVTWETADNLAASTIGGVDVITGAFTQVAYQDPNRPWGLMTGISLPVGGVNTTGRWIGATHAMSAVDMSGALFSIEFMMSAVTSSRFGPKGVVAVFQDSAGAWVAHRLTLRAGLVGGVSYTAVIDLQGATPLDSSGAIDWTDITRIGYLFHRINTNTTGIILRLKNALLLRQAYLVDGCDGSPCTPAMAQTVFDGWGPSAIGSVQGAGQALIRTGWGYGDGSRETYTRTAATSHELPPAPTAAISKRFWNVAPDASAATFTINASAGDTVDLGACVMATGTQQAWEIAATSSASASYNFSGAAIIGWEVTIDGPVTVNGATFSECPAIYLNAGELNGCSISADNAIADVVTDNPERIIGCAFASLGVGHAIRITAPGTYDFEGNTFVGFGADDTTEAEVYNLSGGLVTLNLPLGSHLPTVRNGAGASTVLVFPAFVTIATAGTDTIQMRRASDDTSLASRTGSGTIDVGSYLGEVVYFVRMNGGKDIASSYPATYTLASGDNGTVPLYVGAEVQIGNIDAVAGDVWSYATRTLTSVGGGGDDAATIYEYFTDGSRADAFKADVSAIRADIERSGGILDGLPTLADMEASVPLTTATVDLSSVATKADLTVVNNGVKKASLLIPHTEDMP
jgi:hypothetical protein